MSMLSIYTLTEADVERYVDQDVIFDRGRVYYRARRVIHLDVNDDRLSARVSGSTRRPYQVEIWIDRGILHSTCTCPYDRGACKHVAAALLEWVYRRAPGASPAGSELAEWRARLEAVPPPVLIEHLAYEAENDLLIERYLKRWMRELTPEHLPKLIARLFREVRAASPASLERLCERLLHLLDWADSFPDDQAIPVAVEALKRLPVAFPLLPHPARDDVVERALTIIHRRASRLEEGRVARRKLIYNLLGLIEHQTPAWRAPLMETLTRLAEGCGGLSFLIDVVRQRALGDLRLRRFLAELYKRQGRWDEYERTRVRCLVDEDDYLELFEYYIEENRPEEAMILGERGMNALGVRAPRLAERLTALYLEWGERDMARQHLLRCFRYWPSEQLLQRLDTLSKGRRGWKRQRTRLMKALQAGRR